MHRPTTQTPFLTSLCLLTSRFPSVSDSQFTQLLSLSLSLSLLRNAASRLDYRAFN